MIDFDRSAAVPLITSTQLNCSSKPDVCTLRLPLYVTPAQQHCWCRCAH